MLQWWKLLSFWCEGLVSELLQDKYLISRHVLIRMLKDSNESHKSNIFPEQFKDQDRHEGAPPSPSAQGESTA